MFTFLFLHFKVSGVGMDWFEYYNNVSESAPCYKGRVLLRYRIKIHRPTKYRSKPINVPFRLRLDNNIDQNIFEPPTEYEFYHYHLIYFYN